MKMNVLKSIIRGTPSVDVAKVRSDDERQLYFKDFGRLLDSLYSNERIPLGMSHRLWEQFQSGDYDNLSQGIGFEDFSETLRGRGIFVATNSRDIALGLEPEVLHRKVAMKVVSKFISALKQKRRALTPDEKEAIAEFKKQMDTTPKSKV